MRSSSIQQASNLASCVCCSSSCSCVLVFVVVVAVVCNVASLPCIYDHGNAWQYVANIIRRWPHVPLGQLHVDQHMTEVVEFRNYFVKANLCLQGCPSKVLVT